MTCAKSADTERVQMCEGSGVRQQKRGRRLLRRAHGSPGKVLGSSREFPSRDPGLLDGRETENPRAAARKETEKARRSHAGDIVAAGRFFKTLFEHA